MSKYYYGLVRPANSLSVAPSAEKSPGEKRSRSGVRLCWEVHGGGGSGGTSSRGDSNRS